MKKESNIEKAYKEISSKYSKVPEDEINKEAENLEKEIQGKSKKLETLTGEEKENLSENIKKTQTRLNNIKGYQKNKSQITKIQKFKEGLSEKLKNVKTEKSNSVRAFKNAKDEYEKTEKQLKDEKFTSSLTNAEYNELVERNENAKLEMKKQEEIFKKTNNKIKELEGKIGKCDLAWKTLFTNKTWDDIQKRAIKDKRFTRKVSPSEKLTSKDSEKGNSEAKIREAIGKEVAKIQDEDKAKKEQERKDNSKGEDKNSKNIFKRAWDRIKNFFTTVS